jgi:hypothetical protein
MADVRVNVRTKAGNSYIEVMPEGRAEVFSDRLNAADPLVLRIHRPGRAPQFVMVPVSSVDAVELTPVDGA